MAHVHTEFTVLCNSTSSSDLAEYTFTMSPGPTNDRAIFVFVAATDLNGDLNPSISGVTVGTQAATLVPNQSIVTSFRILAAYRVHAATYTGTDVVVTFSDTQTTCGVLVLQDDKAGAGGLGTVTTTPTTGTSQIPTVTPDAFGDATNSVTMCAIWRNVATTRALLGTTVLPTGDGLMEDAARWTAGTGWDVDVTTPNIATKTAGTAADLEAVANPGIGNGTSYRTFFNSTLTAGAVLLDVGGTNGTSRSTTGLQVWLETIVGGATATRLAIEADASAAGTVDNVAACPIPADTTGYGSWEVTTGGPVIVRVSNGQVTPSATFPASSVLWQALVFEVEDTPSGLSIPIAMHHYTEVGM